MVQERSLEESFFFFKEVTRHQQCASDELSHSLPSFSKAVGGALEWGAPPTSAGQSTRVQSLGETPVHQTSPIF